MIEYQKIKDYYSMDDQTLLLMVQMFDNSILKDYELLKNEIEKSNFVVIKSISHKLKGNFRYFLLNEEADIFEKIQFFAQNQNILEVKSIIVNDLIAKTKTDLETFIHDNVSNL